MLFLFEEEYVESPRCPTLSLSYRTASGSLATDLRGYAGRLPPFFANLLPEGALRELLAKWAEVKPTDEFNLLRVLGADLPGAVTVVAASVLLDVGPGHPARPVGEEPDGGPMRFSLAGVQLKLSAVLKTDGGLTVPAAGIGGDWIVKLPAIRMGMEAVPENEFAMMSLAREIGISVPEVALVTLDRISGLPVEMREWAGNALAVRRFDRPGQGRRLHMEDFAQVFGKFPERKYEGHGYANIASVLADTAGGEAAMDLVRRVVFSALTGNGDMHLKNWAVLYEDSVNPTLSPAYDLVSTIPYIKGEGLALGFGGSRSFLGLDDSRIRRFADAARLPFSGVMSECRSTVERTLEAWRNHEHRGVLPGLIDEVIEMHMESVARDTLRGSFPPKRRRPLNPGR